MKKTVAIFTVLILSAISIQTYAQEYNVLQNRTGFGFHLGHYQAQDAEDGSIFFGAQLRARGEIFGAELSTEYRGEQSYQLDGGGEVITIQIPVTASVLAYAPLGRAFSPYAIAGLGAYFTVYDYEEDNVLDLGDDNETNFGYHIGLGSDIAVSENAAINIDYRYLFLDGNKTA